MSNSLLKKYEWSWQAEDKVYQQQVDLSSHLPLRGIV